MPLHHEGVGL